MTLMPRAAAASSSGRLLASVPQVRIVLTPFDAASARSPPPASLPGPQVTPLTWYGAPLTVSAQLPWLPVTCTALAPVAGAGGVSGVGAGPVSWDTVTAPTLIEPPEVVAA